MIVCVADQIGIVGAEEGIQKHSTHHSTCIHIAMPHGFLEGGRGRGRGKGRGRGRDDSTQIHSKEEANA